MSRGVLTPWNMNGNQINHIGNGVASDDAAAYGQTPAGGNTSGSVSNLSTGATLPAYLAPKTSALTFGSTVSVNAALGNAFNLTVTGNCTISNPSNPVDGQIIRFRVTASGSFTTAWGTSFDFGTGAAPVLSTTSGKVDIIAFEYVASISKWCYLGSGLGY